MTNKKVFYFIENIITGRVRIGWSANPRKLLSVTQTRVGEPLELLAVLKTQKGFHPETMLVDFPARNKAAWYIPTEAFADFIRELDPALTAMNIGPREYRAPVRKREKRRMITSARVDDLPPVASANVMAQVLGVSTSVLSYWIRLGGLPATKKGPATYPYTIQRRDLVAWLQANGYYRPIGEYGGVLADSMALSLYMDPEEPEALESADTPMLPDAQPLLPEPR